MPQTLSRRSPKVQRRLSREQKLRLLDPHATPSLTEWRLEQFRRIFATRYTDAIITRASGGPRDWTRLEDGINPKYLVRHLLADMRPELNPQWIGARSYEASTFVCIDVDCDRHMAKKAQEQPELPPHEMRRLLQSVATTMYLSLKNRCRYLEYVLQQLGIDANDKRQVLIQPTPSGGRHYYLFFHQKEYLFNLEDLFKEAGLRFSKGQFEFFPSTTQGLRLPFGHVPGQPHNPRRWIWFIEAYRRGQIVRHELTELRQRVARIQATWESHPPTPAAASAPTPVRGSRPTQVGIPRAHQSSPQPSVAEATELSAKTIQNVAEIEAIWTQGITLPGTRNAILKKLVAHLVFIRGLSAQDAAESLIKWAMDPRHRSADIAHDLKHGTQVVANEIRRMCSCYEKYRDPARRKLSPPCFTQAEIQFIAQHLEQASPPNVATYAMFLLHFLRFAKQHGTYDAEQRGWVSQPAVNAVIRKWPGCRAEQSKLIVEQAQTVGILKLIKGSYHNPNGKGRARTFLLHIPSEPDQQAVATLEQAEQQLLDLRISHSVNQAASQVTNEVITNTGVQDDQYDPLTTAKSNNYRSASTSSALSQEGTENALEPSSCSSAFTSDVATKLHHHDPADVSPTNPAEFLRKQQLLSDRFFKRNNELLEQARSGYKDCTHPLYRRSNRDGPQPRDH